VHQSNLVRFLKQQKYGGKSKFPAKKVIAPNRSFYRASYALRCHRTKHDSTIIGGTVEINTGTSQ
jgi:hypothetical protein